MKHALRLLHLALCLLLLASCDWRGDHYERLLAEAEEMNRHDSLFTSDSLGLALVRHYDHWWHSRNHRLRAYYMLGCAYRDMGEAPAALHYYHIATEQADTAAADCDFATLFHVYGQMAMIYEQQNMPQEELKALENVSRYALLAGDTLTYLLGYARSLDPYYVMDDTARVLRATEEANQLYLKYGYEQGAARVFPTAIYVSLLNGNYVRARRYMDIFEHESGLFDENGNIASGREHYYNSKGLYYLGTGKTDSAEYYFRRLLPYGYQIEACEGLLSIYEERKNADSIAKYATLYKDAQVQWASSRQSSAIIQSSAMYRYERNQNRAELKGKDARISHQIIALLTAALVIAFLVAYLHFNCMKQVRLQQELEYRKLLEEHIREKEEYHRQCRRLAEMELKYNNLKKNFDDEISRNGVKMQETLQKTQREINRQRELLNSYRDEILEKEEKFIKEEIVSQFRIMADKRFDSNSPRKKDWERLVATYKRYFPHIYARMKVAGLSQQELYSAILTHLGASSSDLGILLNTSKNTISNAKSDANYKLFGQKGAMELASNLKKYAYFE